MPSLRVRPEAEADIGKAYASYEEQVAGLGRAFLVSMDNVFDRISALPLRFPVVYRDVRRALLKRFPFAVFFVLEGDVAVVVAVVAQAADPDRWKNRGGRP